MDKITLTKNSNRTDKRECLICGKVKANMKPFIPCNECASTYLPHGVLLVEVLGKDDKQEATGRIMVMRDIAFEQVFNQSLPKEKVVKVEIGILQRLENHIKENG